MSAPRRASCRDDWHGGASQARQHKSRLRAALLGMATQAGHGRSRQRTAACRSFLATHRSAGAAGHGTVSHGVDLLGLSRHGNATQARRGKALLGGVWQGSSSFWQRRRRNAGSGSARQREDGYGSEAQAAIGGVGTGSSRHRKTSQAWRGSVSFGNAKARQRNAGIASLGAAQLGLAGHGGARLGRAVRGRVWQRGQRSAVQGCVRRGSHGSARHRRHGTSRHGSATRGVATQAMRRSARPGNARSGTAEQRRHGVALLGYVRVVRTRNAGTATQRAQHSALQGVASQATRGKSGHVRQSNAGTARQGSAGRRLETRGQAALGFAGLEDEATRGSWTEKPAPRGALKER